VKKYIREDSGLVILVNGHHIEFLGGLRARLKDGDEISIFPPAAGG